MNAVRATRFMYYTPPPPPAGAYKYIKDTGERRISIRFISRPVRMSTRSTRPEDHYFMSRARARAVATGGISFNESNRCRFCDDLGLFVRTTEVFVNKRGHTSWYRKLIRRAARA